MPMGRPKAELVLSEDERSQLTSIARSRSISAALVTRARIVLAAAAGEPNSAIAQRLQLTRATVGKWRIRFLEHRINGLYDEVRPGKPRTIDDERLAQLIHKTLHTKPADGSTHWSVRTIAAETAISPTSAPLLQAAGPATASQRKLQTLDRSVLHREAARRGRPVPVRGREEPMPGARTHAAHAADGIRLRRRRPPRLRSSGPHHAVRALNVLNGAVLATCKPRHRHQEFLSFLREIDTAVPAELDVHCIVDNYGSHKHPKVKAWLAAHPRWHMHFIPTYSSWLNQVERFFALITDKAIRRGSFSSVKQLIKRIDQFVSHYNENCKPFMWTASADSILAKLQRLCSRISGTEH